MDPKAIYDDLTLITEIHRDPPANIALHLSDAPVGLARMADQHARCEYGVKIIHFQTPHECIVL